jgi:hypothetical protein
MSFKTYDPIRLKQSLLPRSSTLVQSNVRGQTENSEYLISDTATTNLDKVIRTAAGIDTTKMDKVPDAVENNFASFDANGQVKDSEFKVDDTSSGSSMVLYSSRKIKRLLKKSFVQGKFNTVTIPDGITTETILSGAATSDVDSLWSVDKFTAPHKGKFYVQGNVFVTNGVTNADSYILFRIVRYGSETTNSSNKVPLYANTGVLNTDIIATNSFVFDCEPGDVIKFGIFQKTGVNKVVDTSLSFFTVMEL